jgi:hypothetical protein
MSATGDEMNCEEYQQAIAADPAYDGGAAHVADCAACQSFRREMQALNLGIARAMQIDVPPLRMPELPTIDNVVAAPVRKRSVKPYWFALAASLVLATSIGIRMSGVGQEYETLAEAVLAHVDHEPQSLVVTNVAVSEEQLAGVVPAKYARLDSERALITYAMSCKIHGRDVPHLVMQGEHGPITILLMPYEKVAAATPLQGTNVKGVILPVGDGSIAIIGDRDEQLGPVEQQIMNAVTWTT